MTRALVAPSLLSADFATLGADLRRIEAAGADWLHLDVMDGHFVPNLTFGAPVIAGLKPHCNLPFDVHLMIERPEAHLTAFREAGADLLTVHVETCPHLHRTVHAIRELGMRPGVAINPATPVAMIQHVLAEVDLVLVMTVNPGFGGQRFLPAMLPKLREVRSLLTSLGSAARLSVDGGINATTAPLVVEAGADVVVAGSFVFGAEDAAEAIRALQG